MDVQKKLCRLAEIDGFVGTALFSPEGRLLAKCEPADLDLKLIGSLANSVLNTVHKASADMGFGRSQSTCIQTEKALILLRCLNEGNSILRTEPGKCHIHLVLLIDKPESFGIARLESGRVLHELAEEFRLPAAPESSTEAGKPEKPETLQDVAASFDHATMDELFDGIFV